MIRRRALTLVEVLASLVLLTMMAAACLPMLRAATAASPSPENDRARTQIALALERLADRLIESPQGLGAESIDGAESTTLPWPEDLRSLIDGEVPQDAIDVTVLHAIHPPVDHVWVCLTCDDVTINRWIPVERKEESP